jgi:hypothetical protein
VVQVPAWRHLDAMIWAEHSRHADLGNGRFWYPLLALASTGLSVAAAVGAWQHAFPADGVALPVYTAAAFEVIGLSITALAAPNILRVRVPRDAATTQRAFRRFHAWGILRAAFQISAFPLALWALWVLARAG